jgi:hypothetical protein
VPPHRRRRRRCRYAQTLCPRFVLLRSFCPFLLLVYVRCWSVHALLKRQLKDVAHRE